MKYDGPFEVIRKVSSVAYQIRLPASYGIHPVINIAHLESYNASPPEFGNRPHRNLSRADFEALPEYEVERILAERSKPTRNGRSRKEFKVRWIGYDASYDEWLTAKDLTNAPFIMKEWQQSKRKKQVTARLAEVCIV
ncbi:hypothetical protein EVJ58_g9318 [Rhodofomes roseus]|uniref:Chromo domain-containing protein n=1 Tax=Rhodofomes roseus TaxID=34475 RepID=A0A4Y9XYM8_9APHY|nr:hypothetical protein EVJ58_g9318 [Rhodofomes roseus]